MAPLLMSIHFDPIGCLPVASTHSTIGCFAQTSCSHRFVHFPLASCSHEVSFQMLSEHVVNVLLKVLVALPILPTDGEHTIVVGSAVCDREIGRAPIGCPRPPDRQRLRAHSHTGGAPLCWQMLSRGARCAFVPQVVCAPGVCGVRRGAATHMVAGAARPIVAGPLLLCAVGRRPTIT